MLFQFLDWASLEWVHFRKGAGGLDKYLFLGFDLLVHVVLAHSLAQCLSLPHVVISIALAVILTRHRIFNKNTAFCHPSNIPAKTLEQLQPLP